MQVVILLVSVMFAVQVFFASSVVLVVPVYIVAVANDLLCAGNLVPKICSAVGAVFVGDVDSNYTNTRHST